MDSLTRLACAAQAGDKTAMERFVVDSQAEVWRLCARLVGADAADEVTQDTYLRAIPALSRFRHESSARTWLLSIARRACADLIRQRQRRRRLLTRIVANTTIGSVELESSASSEELVSLLDPERREAFVLTQEFGLSYAEAAEICNCPIGTIRSRVSRARSDLLEMLHVVPEDRRHLG
ncbi:MAG: sigma-70 family RNA polymerase sigma factor [Acidimicrobiia bacterium]